MEKGCTCKTCKNHCSCELHRVYEQQENGCNNGEHPIVYCEIKEQEEKKRND